MSAVDTDDLVVWLRKQLDEDAAVIRIVSHGGYAPQAWRTRPSRSGRWVEVYPVERTNIEPPGSEVDEGGLVALVPSGRNEHEHIARHDPARVFQDIEAKRRIIDLHPLARDDGPPYCETCRYGEHPDDEPDPADGYPCPTLRCLALSYDDRPGYRQEWRP